MGKIVRKVISKKCVLIIFVILICKSFSYGIEKEMPEDITEGTIESTEIKEIMWIIPFKKNFRLISIHAVENMSQRLQNTGFTYELILDLLSDKGLPKIEELVGKNMTVVIKIDDNPTRYINGYITEISYDTDRKMCVAVLDPWTYFLTRNANMEIFQNLTVPEIVKRVFSRHKFSDYEFRLSEKYPVKENCVQYKETDFNFVNRILEQEGIYYYFKHKRGKHTLILTDNMKFHKPFNNKSMFTIGKGIGSEGYREKEKISTNIIYGWNYSYKLQPTIYTLKDFDFKNPNSKELSATAKIERPHSFNDFEIYDYPGEYQTPEDAKFYARLRIEELQSDYVRIYGRANSINTFTGFVIDVDDIAAPERKYLVTASNLEISFMDKYYYLSSSFYAIPISETHRPIRLTPKPTISGTQTAIVVSPKADKYGRVRVKFHWTRPNGESSSAWLRVAQPINAEENYVPKVGQEVLVDFLEGNPDRPIISGIFLNENIDVKR